MNTWLKSILIKVDWYGVAALIFVIIGVLYLVRDALQ